MEAGDPFDLPCFPTGLMMKVYKMLFKEQRVIGKFLDMKFRRRLFWELSQYYLSL